MTDKSDRNRKAIVHPISGTSRQRSFTLDGWERIKDFNRKAEDPNYPDIDYTFRKDPKKASEAAKKLKGHKQTPAHKAARMLSRRMTIIEKKIANGQELTEKDMDALSQRISDVKQVKGVTQHLLDRMYGLLDDIDNPLQQAAILDKLSGKYMDVMKMHSAKEDTVMKKLPLDQLNEMMRKRKESKDE